MKAPNFGYAKPADLREALHLLTEDEAVAIAGGQSLIAGLNLRLSTPSLLVDISGLDALRGIRVFDDTIEIGALTRHFEIIASPMIQAEVPLLAEAAGHIAHEAIRNRGTIGGSLAYADPSAEFPACVLALDATLCLASLDGTRRVRAKDFFVDLFETALQPGELVTHVLIPARSGGAPYVFDEIARRAGDFAMAGLIVVTDDAAAWPRFVYFGCADRPRLATNTARLAWRHDFSREDPGDLHAAMKDDIDPSDSVGCRADTKLKLAFALTKRAMARMGRSVQHAAP